MSERSLFSAMIFSNVTAASVPIVFNFMVCQVFLSPIWLPHGQIWATVKGAVSLTLLVTAYDLFQPEGHLEPRNKVGS